MHAKITTTITTMIDLDTMEPDHSVDIEAQAGLPQTMVWAAVTGACKTLLASAPGADQ